MPLVFSYGTLQDDSVQRETFGRLLEGHPDKLLGYERVELELTDPGLIAATGRALHINLKHAGVRSAAVSGTCLSVTDDELARCDRYEQLASYERALVTLESGKRAWVYTFAGT